MKKMLGILLTLLLQCWMVGANGAEVPYTENEVKYLPVLKEEAQSKWPGVPKKSYLAAQVRQETCAGLKSKKCWSPMAELKTNREYGFGLGQITITQSFDNFKTAKELDPSMRDWKWENRYNAQYQLRTLVLMDRSNYERFKWAATGEDQMAFALAAYNGGVGGVLSDRAVCRATPNCDQNVWFGNVELTSKKARTAANGYGQGFFYINRGYVEHITKQYFQRYLPYFNEKE